MPKLDLNPCHLALIDALLDRLVPGLEVWAYGSRVNGSSHAGSDLDLVLRNPQDLSSPSTRLSELRAALTESNLPILVDVLDWALLPESFRLEVEREHVVLR